MLWAANSRALGTGVGRPQAPGGGSQEITWRPSTTSAKCPLRGQEPARLPGVLPGCPARGTLHNLHCPPRPNPTVTSTPKALPRTGTYPRSACTAAKTSGCPKARAWKPSVQRSCAVFSAAACTPPDAVAAQRRALAVHVFRLAEPLA